MSSHDTRAIVNDALALAATAQLRANVASGPIVAAQLSHVAENLVVSMRLLGIFSDEDLEAMIHESTARAVQALAGE